MKRTVILNFPEDFQFPKKCNFKYCNPCPFFQADNEDNDYDYCAASDDDMCPFYEKGENEVIEIECITFTDRENKS